MKKKYLKIDFLLKETSCVSFLENEIFKQFKKPNKFKSFNICKNNKLKNISKMYYLYENNL